MINKNDFIINAWRYDTHHALEHFYKSYKIELEEHSWATIDGVDYKAQGGIEYTAKAALVDSKDFNKPRVEAALVDYGFTLGSTKAFEDDGLDYITLNNGNEVIIGCRYNGIEDYIVIDKDGNYAQGANINDFVLKFEELTPGAHKFLTDNADHIKALTTELKEVREVAVNELGEKAKGDQKLANTIAVAHVGNLQTNDFDKGSKREHAIPQVRNMSIE